MDAEGTIVDNYVLYGGDHFNTFKRLDLTTDLTPDIGIRLTTNHTRHTSGYSDGYRAVSGDFNGDGINDIFMYSSYDGIENFVLYGKQGGFQSTELILEDYVSDPANGFELDRISSRGSRYNWQMDDLDGDGYFDLIMGSGDGGQEKTVIMYGGNFSQSVTHTGTRDNDEIIASMGEDVVLSGDGDDTVWSQGGADWITTGNGNDVIILDTEGFEKIGGDAGFDSVKFTAVVDFDLADYGTNQLNSIEEFDFSNDGGGSTLSLRLLDIIEVSESNLYITGDSEDTVTLVGQNGNQAGWQTSGALVSHPLNDANAYAVYTLGAVTAFIDSDVEVII